MKNFFYLLFFSSICIFGCVCSSNISTDKAVFLEIKSDSISDYSLSIHYGEVLSLDSLAENMYKVRFRSVGGGASYFLGYKFNEVDGDTYPRLTIKTGDKIIRETSLNEILTLDQYNSFDSTIYVLNL